MPQSNTFHSFRCIFCFLIFPTYTLFYQKKEKKKVNHLFSLSVSPFPVSADSRSLHAPIFFPWIYLQLIFPSISVFPFLCSHFATLDCLLPNFAAFLLQPVLFPSSAVPAPCWLQYSNHVPTALRWDCVRSEPCSSHIRYTSLFICDYL